jgi:hypothetical protein
MARLKSRAFTFWHVLGTKKDGLKSPSKVPANAQGECGEDQEAGALRTPYRKQRFQAFYPSFYSPLLRKDAGTSKISSR